MLMKILLRLLTSYKNETNHTLNTTEERKKGKRKKCFENLIKKKN